MFLVGQVSVLVENFKTGVFSDTINTMNDQLYMMILLIKLYLFIPLSIT